MQRSLIRRAQYGLEAEGNRGVHPWRQRVPYKAFKSQYGPDYKIGPHIYGINITRGGRYLGTMAGFGVVAGIFALFFFDGVPKVKKDIMQKIPLIGDYFVDEIAPEDNPF